jgi:rare lipoprotein A
MFIRLTTTVAVAGIILFAVLRLAEAAPVCGKASWYDLTSKTASGEVMNASLLTAAHRDYRFGTKLRITNSGNGRSVIVRVNDRGPFVAGRIVDLSKAAAGKLGFVNAGHAAVCIERVS